MSTTATSTLDDLLQMAAWDVDRDRVVEALAVLDAAGLPNDPDDDPVFGEIVLDASAMSTGLGDVQARVVDAIREQARSLGLTNELSSASSAVIGAVRASAMGGCYEQGLAALMKWVRIELPDLDD